MTKNRHPHHPGTTTPAQTVTVHERYIHAVNSAVADGRESDAHELAATYAEDAAASRQAA